MGVGQVQTTLGAVPREIGGDGDERRLGLVAARGGIFGCRLKRFVSRGSASYSLLDLTVACVFILELVLCVRTISKYGLTSKLKDTATRPSPAHVYMRSGARLQRISGRCSRRCYGPAALATHAHPPACVSVGGSGT